MPSTHNKVWGSTTPESSSGVHELTAPSGQTCSARKMTIDRLMSSGILTKSDSLTALVTQYIDGKGPKKAIDEATIMKTLMTDDTGLEAIFDLCDRALPSIVVSPPVSLHYADVTVGKTTIQRDLTPEQRAEILAVSPDTVFTDQIEFEDKMFLFEWATGGIGQAAAFRGGSANGMGTVAHGPQPPRKAKRARRKS